MSLAVFATAVNCIDGRAQMPVISYIKSKLNVQYVDMITEAGTVKYFDDPGNPRMEEAIKKSVMVSVEAHKSSNVFVIAHADCAGNPVDTTVQKQQALQAKSKMESWGLPIKVFSLWVNENWQVEEV